MLSKALPSIYFRAAPRSIKHSHEVLRDVWGMPRWGTNKSRHTPPSAVITAEQEAKTPPVSATSCTERPLGLQREERRGNRTGGGSQTPGSSSQPLQAAPRRAPCCDLPAGRKGKRKQLIPRRARGAASSR